MNKQIELSYYALYLRAFLADHPEAAALDAVSITIRAARAAEEFERLRRDGLPVHRAHEGAVCVLLSNLGNDEEDGL